MLRYIKLVVPIGLLIPLAGCAKKEAPSGPVAPATSESAPEPAKTPAPTLQPATPAFSPSKIAAPATRAAGKAGQEPEPESGE